MRGLGIGLVVLLAGGPLLADEPARLHVLLPPSASLTINGGKTSQTSGNRHFESPPLKPGKTYWYTLKATFVRDESLVAIERKVPVRAGETTTVSLDVPVSKHSLYRSHFENNPGVNPHPNLIDAIAAMEAILAEEEAAEASSEFQLYDP